MCGIFVSISRPTSSQTAGNALSEDLTSTILQSRLKSRGPDSYGEQQRTINKFRVTFVSTVLSLRNPSNGSVQRQPYSGQQNHDRQNACKGVGDNTNAKEPLLLWNGEAWAIDQTHVGTNDTAVVFDHLAAAVAFGEDAIINALSKISGPFATVFYDGDSKIYIARDCLGRRSLVWRRVQEENCCVEIASVGDDSQGWKEIEAEGIFVIDLSGNDSDVGDLDFSATVMSNEISAKSNGHDEKENTHVRRSSQIRHWAYINAGKYASLNRSVPTSPNDSSESLTTDSSSLQNLELLLRASLKDRVENIPTPPKLLHSTKSTGNTSKLAILFSGGLDCTLLARMIHDHLPPDQPIDLLNAAFHNPRSHGAQPSSQAYESCPDRITAQSSVAELRTICPERTWRLVLVNVPYAETLAHRDTIRSLMAPHNTEMDLSIATALYFASRGIGTLDTDTTGSEAPYHTPARILISGLGADELFGGYQRHATAFSRHGHGTLLDELALDITRLGKRNLGRDDRVLAHWGREARYPYLDETFVRWAVEQPVWLKCGFGMAHGQSGETDEDPRLEPGKLALRLLARKLGMRRVAAEKKRAIQFGARTAKMGGDGKTKGTQVVT